MVTEGEHRILAKLAGLTARLDAVERIANLAYAKALAAEATAHGVQQQLRDDDDEDENETEDYAWQWLEGRDLTIGVDVPDQHDDLVYEIVRIIARRDDNGCSATTDDTRFWSLAILSKLGFHSRGIEPGISGSS